MTSYGIVLSNFDTIFDLSIQYEVRIGIIKPNFTWNLALIKPHTSNMTVSSIDVSSRPFGVIVLFFGILTLAKSDYTLNI